MKTNFIKFFILFFLMSSFSFAEKIVSKCVYVIDGDSIVVLQENSPVKIVLEGIDCPEKEQPYGDKATEFIKELVLFKTVTVNYEKKDEYGRLIGRVFVGDVDVNYLLVKKGYAWHYKRFSKEEKLKNAEIEAKNEKLGLWTESNPTPPWVWREKKKANLSVIL